MLPSKLVLAYQALQQELFSLQQTFADPNRALDPPSLQLQLLSLEQMFHQEIVKMACPDLSGAAASRMQSLQTEINKQLRLSKMEALFLQSARQSATVQQRQGQLRQHLDLLIQYCEAILQLSQEPHEG